MRIVLIGSGNVATVLGRKLYRAGHTIAQVLSRDPDHARRLAGELNASAISEPVNLVADADIYLFAISDAGLSDLEQWKFFTPNIAVHTAGSISREVLKSMSKNYGVMYPLQTLRKEIDTINEIPFLIDGSNEATAARIDELASSVSTVVRRAGDEERKKLHLAAVMSNNFSNHLFGLARSFCEKEGVDFSLLYPLILEGAMRIKEHSPLELQTGPAMRNDEQTISTHRTMLQQYPQLLKLYDLFTESIRHLRS